ncbi:carboxypeptidase-like regulatory domain-containing protein [Granulicella tundricola]|uniref:TonB-dependent transporter Oar-like beta-barrel domain-containing protein n=1 Tax=Granulicella tundricola (strain ATCC BAA-1859 / DSM 23138 / MP5ACTX9) TaxID=1198114 RepID=E8X3R9_GRATM|nr:carboxypeptidase-like regulatory domain-containing protein [Granulicella tundricola]ADW69347.1 hypothetical protein AciX9_2310 [Granulicella tundricola MP5ACTX9]
MQTFCLRSGRRILLGLALALASSSLLSAQTNTTALSGTVTDASGALMPGVAISISNPASGSVQNTSTHSKGEFSFDQIPPGTYVVKVLAPGFSEQDEQVELLVATPVKMDFKLTVGTSEVVNVETNIAALNATDASLGKAFDSKQIQNLPYLANNITYLLSLQPGVLALDSGAQTGGLNTDTRTGIVNGARQDQTNISLDGVDNNDQTNGYAFNGALRATRESVEEFRVTTTGSNADAGRSSGGQVSLVTRSGTNTYHGSAYEYYRGGIGLQNNWFNKQTQLNTNTGNVPLKVLQNTYGASFGAPIIRDKLFFFAAYEGFKQASDQQVAATVPSLFSASGTAQGLVTGNVTYQVCPSSVVCKSSTATKTLTPTDIATLDGRANDPVCSTSACTAPTTNAAAIAYMKQFPLANNNTGGDGFNTGTYSFASPLPLHQITNIARVDYTINPRQTLFVRGNLQSDNQAAALTFPGLLAASNTFGNNKGMAAGHIWNLNSAMSNNFRYGFIRQGTATRGTGSQPYVTFSAFTTISATTTSTIYKITTNNFADDFTITKGRHTIQFGVNDRLLSNSRYFDSPLLSNASVTSSLLALAAVANTGSSYDPAIGTCADCGTVSSGFANSYNAAILANGGVIESGKSGTEYLVQNGSLVPAGAGVVPTHIYHNLEQEYYIQDQWKASPRFTVTAGLRYNYYGVPYEIHGQQIAPTIAANTLLQNRVAGANSGTSYNTPISFAVSGSANNAPNFWTPQKGNFAPRISFAYATPDNRTSIRGGFSLVFDHFGEGVVDYYDAGTSSLLSLSKSNTFSYTDVNTNPRFTGYHNVPLGTVTVATTALPATPANNEFTFLKTVNSIQKTPYAEAFNFTIQREVTHGLTLTGSYVGRLGRHLSDAIDVAQPNNLLDTASQQTYFQAATAYDKMIDAGVATNTVANTGYFQNLFPKAAYKGFTGAQAFYAFMAANRGNETAALYQFDYTAGAASSPAGQSNRFFYPQTSSIYVQSTIANSNYNALQMSARHVLRYGLEYDLNYTYSKSLDQGSSPERSASNYIVNTVNPSQMYAPSDFDVRHNITANYNAPLPFGKGKPFLGHANGLVDRLIGGWQLNGVVHYSTAFPFSASISNGFGTNFDSSSNYIQTGPIPTGGHHYVPGGNYETALNGITVTQAFANLRAAYVGETGQRNNFRADGYFSMDDGFSKSFRTFREQAFKIQVEVFNVTGSTRFNALTATGNSTKFGQYTGGSATTTGLLGQPRQMQFSGKYSF